MAMDQAPEAMEGAPPPEGGEGMQGDRVTQMIGQVSDGLGLTAQLFSQMPDIDPADMEALSAMADQYRAIISKYAGGEAPAAAPAKNKQVPVQSMQGRPVGPQGMM